MAFTEFWKKGYYVYSGGSRQLGGGDKQMLGTTLYKPTVYCRQITPLTVYLFI